MHFQPLTSEMVFWIVVAIIAIAWFTAIIAYFTVGIMGDRRMRQLMRDFEERFPGRCFLCSWYRHVVMCPPPEHDCSDWGGD